MEKIELYRQACHEWMEIFAKEYVSEYNRFGETHPGMVQELREESAVICAGNIAYSYISQKYYIPIEDLKQIVEELTKNM